MQNNQDLISLKILNEAYQIRCNAEEIHSLQQAGHLVESKMLELQKEKIANDQLAIITAVRFAHAFLQEQAQRAKDNEEINAHIHALKEKIVNALTEADQVAV